MNIKTLEGLKPFHRIIHLEIPLAAVSMLVLVRDLLASLLLQMCRCISNLFIGGQV